MWILLRLSLAAWAHVANELPTKGFKDELGFDGYANTVFGYKEYALA